MPARCSNEVQAMACDLMGTLLWFRRPRHEVLAELYGSVLTTPVDPDRLARELDRARPRHPQTRYGTPTDRWTAINVEVLGRLGKTGGLAEAGRSIHRQLVADPCHYMVPWEIRCFLERRRQQGIKLGVLTNERRNDARFFVRTFELGGFFGSRVVTSQDVGCYKPSLRFLRRGLNRLGFPPRSTFRLCNSVWDDLPGVWVTRTGLLVSDRRRLTRAEAAALHSADVRRAQRQGQLVIARGVKEMERELVAANWLPANDARHEVEDARGARIAS